MSFGIWQRTITDDAGNVLPGASIEVREPSSDFTGALVFLFSNEAGGNGLSNPFNADSEGFAQFYAAPRKVDIRATGAGSQRTWRNVEILGTAAIQDTSRFPYVVGSVADLASVSEGLRVDGAAFRTTEFWPGTNVGGTNLIWKSDEPTANHNGGTVIDPLRVSALDSATKTFNGYHTPVAGNFGCFVAKNTSTARLSQYGGVFDGETDNIEPARAMAVSANKLIFDGPNIFIGGSTYDAGADWRHHIVIGRENTSIEFEQGALVLTSTAFSDRAVLFLVRASGVTFDGVKTRDLNTAGNNWVIPIGCGSAYDSSYPNDTLTDLSVAGSRFENSWISVSVQFVSSDGGGKGFSGVKVSRCVSKAREGNTSSGNFNFRSDGPWKISDVNIEDCQAYDGATSSSFNFYGVNGFSASNITSYRNLYAGHEIENGSQDGLTTNFRSVDDHWGLWIDDSRRIKVNGVSHKTMTEELSSPLWGTARRYREAVKITRQGFSGYENWVTEGISVSGIISDFGRIRVSEFGSDPQGAFGRIQISDFQFYGDGVARQNSNTVVQIQNNCPDFSLTNGLVVGAPQRALEFSLSSGGRHRVEGVETRPVGSESTDGLVAVGDGRLSLVDVDTHSLDVSVSVREQIEVRVAGSLVEDIRNNARIYYSANGDPEGVLDGGPGSLVTRQDRGALYFKSEGIGSSGWREIFGFEQDGTPPPNGDLNDIRDTGFYDGSGALNRPTGGGQWTVLALRRAENRLSMVAYSAPTEDTFPVLQYQRFLHQTGWSPWKKILTEDDLT